MNWLRLGFSLSATAILAGTMSAQFVAGITGLVNTGATVVSGNDPNYALISHPGATPLSDVVVTLPNAAWLPNDADSKWIGPFADARASAPPAPVGNYVYQLTFNIAGSVGNPDNVAITGLWATDNWGLEILVNGNASQSFNFATNSYASLAPFTLSGPGLFTTGQNSLQFLVHNSTGASNNPTGLRVEFTSAIPEPSTYALILGVVALGVVGLRRLRTRRSVAGVA